MASGPCSPAFSLTEIPFGFEFLPHMIRTSALDLSPRGVNRLLKAPPKERKAAIIQAFMLDPYVMRKIVHSSEDDAVRIGPRAIIPRDFDLWMRCATQLGHRGDQIPPLFDRWFQGSALNAQPEKYGKCPFGKWEVLKEQEPHLLSREKYPAQVEQMDRIIDNCMAEKVGKREHLGRMLRQLIWDLYTATSYGVDPGPDTARMLKIFEDHSNEFDYSMRLSIARVPYEWSARLKQQVKDIGDWCWDVAQDRQANISQHMDKTDVLTDMILNHNDVDLRKSEGALRGVFTGGMNNAHAAVCGILIANATSNDSVYDYMLADSYNVEYVMREGLRLYTAVPTSRTVRAEDNLVVDGRKLRTGTSVLLSTYVINTDPRSWIDPLTFNPERFEGTEELGFLCQKGFAPLGAPAELGGRQCGARYHDAHMLRTVIRKLITDYRFTKVGGRDFEFKQNGGTSMYASNCEMFVQRR